MSVNENQSCREEGTPPLHMKKRMNSMFGNKMINVVSNKFIWSVKNKWGYRINYGDETLGGKTGSGSNH